MEAFRYCCESNCKDPRDKIYGLQVLIPTRQRVIVDYSLTAMQVFLSTVGKLLDPRTGGSMNEYDSMDLVRLAQTMNLAWMMILRRFSGQKARAQNQSHPVNSSM
jgi:hypothetical protein